MIFIFSCSEREKIEVVTNNDFCELQEEDIETFPYLLVNELDLVKYEGSVIINLLGPKEKFPDSQKNSLIILLGKRSSNIYSIEFLRSVQTEKLLRIFVKEVLKDGVIPVETYPCLTLRIPKNNKNIEIVWEGEPLEVPIIKKGKY